MNRGKYLEGRSRRPFRVSTTDQTIKEARELVIFALRDWIKFVIMTLGTFHGQAKKGSRGSIDTIYKIFDSIILINDPSLIGCWVIAKKACGQFLFVRGLRNQVP